MAGKKYLPDTNIFIRAFFGVEPEASFLAREITNNAIAISVVVIGEFYSKPTQTEKASFELLLNQFEIIPIDSVVAKLAGEYRRNSIRKTKRVYLTDCFLAAQAKLHNLTLITNNHADFPMKDMA